MSAPIAIDPERIFEAVEAERMRLLNVIGVVQCMQIAAGADDPPPELEGAVALVEEHLQTIAERLDRLVLERSLRATETQP
jgi:hypothetical protein